MPMPTATQQKDYIEQLTEQLGRLTKEIKAKENAIKEIESRTKIAEEESVLRLNALDRQYQEHRANLEGEVAPLQDLKQQVANLRTELVDLRNARQDQLARDREARHNILSALEEQIASSQGQLSNITAAIHELKQRVVNI